MSLTQTGTAGAAETGDWRSFSLLDTNTTGTTRTESGNEIIGDRTAVTTASTLGTLTKSDSYINGQSDSQTVTTVSNSTVTLTENSFTGTFTEDALSLRTVTTQETGLRASQNYTLSATVTTTGDSLTTGNRVSGEKSATTTLTELASVSTSGSRAGGSYALSRESDTTSTLIETGNVLTGTYTHSESTQSAVSLLQTTVSGAYGTTLDVDETRQTSRTETGNALTGAFTKTVEETASTTLVQSGTDSAGAFTLSQTTADDNTITSTGNSVTGVYTLSTSGTQVYTVDQTLTDLSLQTTVYSLEAQGTKTHSGTQVGTTVTGGYSLTQTGSDSYTLSQSGTLGTKAYDQTLTGTEAYGLSEYGNATHGGFVRNVAGSGSAHLVETGTDNGTPFSIDTTVTPNWSQSETGNYLSGSISRTSTGEDRYALLEQFHDSSNAADGSAAGVLDYSPVGAVFFAGNLPNSPTGGGSYPARQTPQAAEQDPFAKEALDLLHEYCFAKGTLVLTDHGPQAIETLQPGDRVLSVPDTAPESEPTWHDITQVYHNAPARLLNVHVGALVLRTTPNHPFYVRQKGWQPAGTLAIGDELRTSDGAWTPITDVFDNGDVEPVFNLRIDGTRTYFVADEYGDTVLAHNESPNEASPSVGGLMSDGSAKIISLKIDPSVAAALERNGVLQSIAIGDHEETQFPGWPTVRDHVSPELLPFLSNDQQPEIAGSHVAVLKQSGEAVLRANPDQRAVYTYDGTRRKAIVPSGWGYKVPNDSPLSHSPQALADLAIHDRDEIEARQAAAGGLTAALHVVPFGAASDYFSEEGIDSREAWVSVAADGAAFLTCGGTKALRVTGMAVEGGVIAIRGYEVGEALQSGDGWAAAGKGAEIVLRATALRGASKGFKELPLGVRGELLDEAGNLSLTRTLKNIHANERGSIQFGRVPASTRPDLAEYVKHPKGSLPEPGGDWVLGEGAKPVTGAAGWIDQHGTKKTQVLVSGVRNAEGSGTLAPYSGPGAVPGVTSLNAHHPEIQMAYKMRMEGIRNGELWINDPLGPCGLTSARQLGCTRDNLAQILPKGYTLNIYWTTPDGIVDCLPVTGR